MGRHFRVSFSKPEHNNPPPPQPAPAASDPVQPDLVSPFGKINGLNQDDFQQAAYEVFFMACRSSPGFSSRNNSFSEGDGNAVAPGSPMKAQGVGMAVTSKVKTALGLKMLNKSLSMTRSRSWRRMSSGGLNLNLNYAPSSPTAGGGGGSSPRVGLTVPQGGRLKRPMTSAEIIKQQLRVTEQSDNMLRKTLTKALVGQIGRRAETMILPLELLRHVKPSEFNDANEYHLWQKRQLKILEAGLLLHPSTSHQKSNPHVTKLKEVIQAAEIKPLDTGRNTRTMRALSDCVSSLACRGGSEYGGTEQCHWADGYPLNVHLYMALLYSVFDLRDKTLVLDEVDELLELIKKTWPILGFNRAMHNLCFAWALFEQFVATGQVEPDLLGASFAMLREVESDAKKQVDRDPKYMKILASVLAVTSKWSEKRLLDYHANFNRTTTGLMSNMVPLLSSSTKILRDDVASSHRKGASHDELTGNKIEDCIRSSLKNAFAKMVDTEGKLTSQALIELATKTQGLAEKEKDIFTPILNKWCPLAAGTASLTLHSSYGILLKQFVSRKSWQLNEVLAVLQRAGMLEKALMEMAVDESIDCDDGGKGISKKMVPYEVETIISRLLKQWIQDKLDKGREHMLRVQQTETWNPKLKTEPYAHSAMELVAFAKEAVNSFFQLTVTIPETLFHDFVYGLENIIFDYTTFVASCGSNQNYLPTIPPITRYSRDSTLFKLWKKAACSVAVESRNWDLSNEEHNQMRAITSRGTQRLYIRLNSLHYLSSQLQSLEKTLSASPNIASPKASLGNRRQPSYTHLEKCLSAIQTASQHVAQVAASRLIFLDLNSVFYGNLYNGSVVRARIGPVIQSLKHNLAILCAIVIERAQPQVLKEVMKASFESFLRAILTGGSSRVFTRADHSMMEEDLESLKHVFCVCGEGLIVEDMIEMEAEAAGGVVALMGQTTEQLIEDFISSVTNGGCGVNMMSPKQKLPIPPTTGNWSRSDPNTILRALCGRKDRIAIDFLKKTLNMAKKRSGIKMI